MRLLNASRYFDDVLMRDAYTNAPLFKGQAAAYIDSQVDGTISRRRVISLAPNLTPPARKVVKYNREVWMLGDGVKDSLQGVELRVSYAAKKCDTTFLIQTPGNACLNTTGVTAYGQADYLKSTVNGPTDSNYDGQYEVHFASSETVLQGYVLSSAGRYFHVRGRHTLLEGFIVAEADELDSGPVAVTLTDTGTYDPVTDAYSGSSVATTGLFLDMYKLYQYRTAKDPHNEAGDASLLIAASATTPVVGQTVNSAWRIAQVLPQLDAHLCHLRRL